MAKTEEEKRAKFDTMMTSRLEKAVKAISLLENLNRTADYAWDKEDITTMLNSMYDAVDGVSAAFGGAGEVAETPEEPEEEEADPEPVDDWEDDTLVRHADETRVVQPAEQVLGTVVDPIEDAVVNGVDKADLKDAYLMIAKGNVDEGLQLMKEVILGWLPPEEPS